MPLVASVRLRYASQDYWFDPAGLDIKAGDHVLVETSKGNEIGLCTHDVVDVDEAEVTKPLKPVIRIATEEDLAKSDVILVGPGMGTSAHATRPACSAAWVTAARSCVARAWVASSNR